jgi:uncharacterized membrane protein YczE
LFWGHAALVAIAGIVLLVTITDANAGYPALFFGGIVAAVSVPVWMLSFAFAAMALIRREPLPLGTVVVAVLSGLLLAACLPVAYRIVKAILGT